MASPQAENGHLRIATEIVEQLARIVLSAYEWAVLWCVWRLTWAWQKKSDVVPVSRIAAMTGLRKQHASRARLNLIGKRLLIEDRGRIRFNKDYEQWEVKRRGVTNLDYSVTSTGDAGVTNLGESVTSTGDKTSPVEEPQKKERNYTKERGRAATFDKPTVDEVKAYAQSIKYDLDAEYFVDWYEARGWVLKNAPMKDWRAVVRTWKRREEQSGKSPTASKPLERGPSGLTPREQFYKDKGLKS